MSYTNGRYDCNHDYKAKLFGILPTGFKYTENSRPWHTENIKVCKKPSEQTQKGQIDFAGHPTLVGSAIVERKHQISEFISIDIDDSSNSESTSCSDEDNHDIGAELLQCDDMSKVNHGSVASCQSKTDQINGNRDKATESINSYDKDSKNERNVGLAVTNFLQYCFDSKTNQVPDFICERLVAIFLGSDTDSFVIQARKVHLMSKDSSGTQQSTIELKFLPHSVKAFSFIDAGWVGPVFANWALTDSNKEDSATTVNLSMRNTKFSEGEDSDANQKDGSDEEEEGTLFLHHHHAFIQGDISRTNQKNNQTKKFSLLMSALVGGVWSVEENPEDYTCAHLCEMRTAQENTVSPYTATGKRNTFYKRVRMKRNWLQAHLAGEKHYLVGINGSVNGDLYSRVIKELWLYDVEKIPRAIQISAEDENFMPWTPEELHEKLFNALQVIHETMKNAKPDELFTFIQYSDCDSLVYDADNDLHSQYLELKKKIVISGLPTPTSDENQHQFDRQLLLTILNCVGYPLETALPEVQRISRDLELTFASHSLATSFMEVVKGYWSKRKNIPQGYEKLWIQQKSITLPSGHPLHQNHRQSQHAQRFQRSPSDYYHGESSRYVQTRSGDNRHNINGYRPMHVARQRSLSDCDDNWRK